MASADDGTNTLVGPRADNAPSDEAGYGYASPRTMGDLNSSQVDISLLDDAPAGSPSDTSQVSTPVKLSAVAAYRSRPRGAVQSVSLASPVTQHDASSMRAYPAGSQVQSDLSSPIVGLQTVDSVIGLDSSTGYSTLDHAPVTSSEQPAAVQSVTGDPDTVSDASSDGGAEAAEPQL